MIRFVIQPNLLSQLLSSLREASHPQLDEDGIKEKRRQKLMKSLHDGRVRQREERAKEKAESEEQARLEALERDNDFAGWSTKWRQEHEVILYQACNPALTELYSYAACNAEDEGKGKTEGGTF